MPINSIQNKVGGLLDTPEALLAMDLGKGLLSVAPVSGEIMSAQDAVDEYKKGNYWMSLLAGLGAIPIAGTALRLGSKGVGAVSDLARMYPNQMGAIGRDESILDDIINSFSNSKAKEYEELDKALYEEALFSDEFADELPSAETSLKKLRELEIEDGYKYIDGGRRRVKRYEAGNTFKKYLNKSEVPDNLDDLFESFAKSRTVPYDSVVKEYPVSELDKYKEWSRLTPRDGDAAYQALKKDIEKNGIKEPVYITLTKDDDQALMYLGEGNHRLRAAKELGIENIPVRFVSY